MCLHVFCVSKFTLTTSNTLFSFFWNFALNAVPPSLAQVYALSTRLADLASKASSTNSKEAALAQVSQAVIDHCVLSKLILALACEHIGQTPEDSTVITDEVFDKVLGESEQDSKLRKKKLMASSPCSSVIMSSACASDIDMGDLSPVYKNEEIQPLIQHENDTSGVIVLFHNLLLGTNLNKHFFSVGKIGLRMILAVQNDFGHGLAWWKLEHVELMLFGIVTTSNFWILFRFTLSTTTTWKNTNVQNECVR